MDALINALIKDVEGRNARSNKKNKMAEKSKRPSKIGQYEVLQTLGTGSFGKVKCGCQRAEISITRTLT